MREAEPRPCTILAFSIWPTGSPAALSTRLSASPIPPGNRPPSDAGGPVEGSRHQLQDQRPTVGQVLGALGQSAVRLHRMDAPPTGLHGIGARLSLRRAVERIMTPEDIGYFFPRGEDIFGIKVRGFLLTRQIPRGAPCVAGHPGCST